MIPTENVLTATARHLLDLQLDAVPTFRILRDVLSTPPTDPSYQAAQQRLCQHKHVIELYATQHEDGTWGRFHTQDTSIKQRFVTTEVAIERAFALGLDKDTPLLKRAAGFICDHLTGQVAWSDPPEKHDHPMLWYYGTQLISAAYLALIDPLHPLLRERQQHLIEMLTIAFRSGQYRPQDEIKARTELTGITSKAPAGYLLAKYCLILLASASEQLAPSLEDQLLTHILRKPGGIYYINSACLQDFPTVQDKRFIGWFNAVELLSHFNGWKRHAAQFTAWIWDQRGADGLWDFGSRAADGRYFPLSADWRKKGNRAIDCTVRVLALLERLS